MDNTLSDFAAIAEIIGTIAVVISLIFVGLQINQNTRATKSAAAQAVHSNFAAWYASLQGEPAILELSIEGMLDYSTMSQSDKAQFFAMFMAFNAHMQDAFYKLSDGSLDSELWNGWEHLAATFYSTPGGKAFWRERGYMFGERFRSYIENELMPRPLHPNARPWGRKLGAEMNEISGTSSDD